MTSGWSDSNFTRSGQLWRNSSERQLQESLFKAEIFRSRHGSRGLVPFCVITVFMPAVNPPYQIKRPAEVQKPIPAIAKLTMSAIMAVPHGLLDIRPVGNAQIPQCQVVEFCDGSNGLLDLPFAQALVGGSERRSSRRGLIGIVIKSG